MNPSPKFPFFAIFKSNTLYLTMLTLVNVMLIDIFLIFFASVAFKHFEREI